MSSPPRTRSAARRAIAGLAVGVVLAATVVACGGDKGDRGGVSAGLRAEPTAGEWTTWVLGSPTEISGPPPPKAGSEEREAELDEVERRSGSRGPQIEEAVRRWSSPVPTQPWTDTAYDFVSRSAKNPPLSSRNYGLLHVAMYDAVVTAWHYKYAYDREAPRGVEPLVPAGPDPSYPSEHAAIAGAASRVLAFLYPDRSVLRLDEMADEAAASRVAAGTNAPSDVAAGLELGRAVAEKVIARARSDGAGAPWVGARPAGIGDGPEFWEPPPGSASPPVEPLAGTWRTWVLTSGSQLRPPPPPAYGSPKFRAAANEIVEIGKDLTAREREVAKAWEGAEGTKLPAGLTLAIASTDVSKAASDGPPEARMTVPRSARAMAMMGVALADAGIAAWDAKYAYWNPRPENAVRDLGLDPEWKPYLPTPTFPAYPSGSAGYAGAVQAVMDYLFPAATVTHRQRAEEQTESRLYAGIHWRYDAVSLDTGRHIGRMVVARAMADGADGRQPGR